MPIFLLHLPYISRISSQVRAWFLGQARALPPPPPRRPALLCQLRIALLAGEGGLQPHPGSGSAGGLCLGGGSAAGVPAAATPAAREAEAGAEAAARAGAGPGVEAEAEARSGAGAGAGAGAAAAEEMPEALALCFGQLALLLATGGGQALILVSTAIVSTARLPPRHRRRAGTLVLTPFLVITPWRPARPTFRQTTSP